MRRMKRFTTVLAVIVTALLIVSACGGPPPNGGDNGTPDETDATGDTDDTMDDGTDDGAPPAEEQVLNVGLDVDASTLDSRLMDNTTGYRASELIYDGLVYLDENLEPQPSLAADWEQTDDTTWVFDLRDDVTFHDGEPFTAEDVVHTYETILDEDFNAPQRSLYTPIDSIEATGEHTVQFNLSQPYAPLVTYLDRGIVPEHVSDDQQGTEPVGTGPFSFATWDRDSQIVVEANPDYWGGEPTLERIVLNIIPDNTSRAVALQSGDVDFIHSPLSPQDLPDLRNDEDVDVTQMTSLGHTYVNFNISDPLIGDVRIRQALAMLIDQEAIIGDIYQNMDQAATSPLLPAWPAYDESITQPTYDPEGAQDLLEEAGWTDSDGDGIRDQDGEPLSIDLTTHSEDPNRVQVVQYMQNTMNQAGVEVEVGTSQWPDFSAAVQNGEHQVAVLGWLNLVDPDRGMYNQFHSEGGFNYGSYANEEVDQYVEQGRTAGSLDERNEAYRSAAEILVEELPYYVVGYQGYVIAQDTALEGFQPTPKASFRGFKDASLGE